MIFFAYPLSSLLSLWININSTLVNIIYRTIILFSSLFIISYISLKKELKINRKSYPLLFFLFIYLIRIIYDTLIARIDTTHTILEIYSFFIGNIIFPIIAILIAFKYVNFESFVKFSISTLFFSNIFMLLTYLYQIEWDITPLIFLKRASITGLEKGTDLINPISFSFYGGSLFLFCFFYLLIINKKSLSIKSIFLLFSSALGVLNLVLGNSRGPFLFTFIAIVGIYYYYFEFSKPSGAIVKRLSYSILFLTIFFIFISNYVSLNSIEFGIFERLLETKEIVETGQEDDRSILFREALEMFYEQPIFGNQMNLKSLSYPHNFFLELLMSLGLIGLLLFSQSLIYLALLFYNSPQRSKIFCIWIPFSILVFGISMTTGNMYQNVIFWNLIGMLLAWPKKNIEKAKVFF